MSSRASVSALAVVLGGALLLGGPQRAAAATLHAHWSFDGTGGDSSGNGLDATIEGGAGFGAGMVGQALLLDGIDDRAVVADDPLLDFDTGDPFSVALWLRIDMTHQAATAASRGIVEKWAGSGGYPYTLRALLDSNRYPTGTIYAARYDGPSLGNGPNVGSSGVLNDGAWHHVAFVKDGSLLKLYVDGDLVDTATDTTVGSTVNSASLYIGSRSDGAYLAGAIDELRIYGGALTADEVQALASVAVPEPGRAALAVVAALAAVLARRRV